MSEDLELVRGRGDPFEDVGLPEADTKLIKADLAAEIIAILRERQLTGRPRPSWPTSRRPIYPASVMPTCPGLPLTGW